MLLKNEEEYFAVKKTDGKSRLLQEQNRDVKNQSG